MTFMVSCASDKKKASGWRWPANQAGAIRLDDFNNIIDVLSEKVNLLIDSINLLVDSINEIVENVKPKVEGQVHPLRLGNRCTYVKQNLCR